eukprot:g6460.t1
MCDGDEWWMIDYYTEQKRGPFRRQKMLYWFKEGYLPETVEVCTEKDGTFYPLRVLNEKAQSECIFNDNEDVGIVLDTFSSAKSSSSAEARLSFAENKKQREKIERQQIQIETLKRKREQIQLQEEKVVPTESTWIVHGNGDTKLKSLDVREEFCEPKNTEEDEELTTLYNLNLVGHYFYGNMYEALKSEGKEETVLMHERIFKVIGLTGNGNYIVCPVPYSLKTSNKGLGTSLYTCFCMEAESVSSVRKVVKRNAKSGCTSDIFKGIPLTKNFIPKVPEEKRWKNVPCDTTMIERTERYQCFLSAVVQCLLTLPQVQWMLMSLLDHKDRNFRSQMHKNDFFQDIKNTKEEVVLESKLCTVLCTMLIKLLFHYERKKTERINFWPLLDILSLFTIQQLHNKCCDSNQKQIIEKSKFEKCFPGVFETHDFSHWNVDSLMRFFFVLLGKYLVKEEKLDVTRIQNVAVDKLHVVGETDGKGYSNMIEEKNFYTAKMFGSNIQINLDVKTFMNERKLRQKFAFPTKIRYKNKDYSFFSAALKHVRILKDEEVFKKEDIDRLQGAFEKKGIEVVENGIEGIESLEKYKVVNVKFEQREEGKDYYNDVVTLENCRNGQEETITIDYNNSHNVLVPTRQFDSFVRHFTYIRQERGKIGKGEGLTSKYIYLRETSSRVESITRRESTARCKADSFARLNTMLNQQRWNEAGSLPVMIMYAQDFEDEQKSKSIPTFHNSMKKSLPHKYYEAGLLTKKVKRRGRRKMRKNDFREEET